MAGNQPQMVDSKTIKQAFKRGKNKKNGGQPPKHIAYGRYKQKQHLFSGIQVAKSRAV